jgi:hypothetical protein
MTTPNPSAHDLLAALTSAVIWAEGVAANPTYSGHRVTLAERLTEARTAEAAYRGDGTSPITDAIQRSARGKR